MLQKKQILTPEEVSSNTKYTFTINPAAQYEDQKNRLRTAVNAHMQTFKSLGDDKVCTWELYPELSRGGRIHYHGWIQIHNRLKFYLNLMRFLNKNQVEIDTIEDMNVWETYCTKQKDMFQTKVKYYPFKSIKNNQILKETGDAVYVKDITQFMV